MLFRIICGALVRQKRRALLTGLTMALGISLAAAMLVIVFGLSDQVNRELKAFGANIVVTQKTAALTKDLFGEAGQLPQKRLLEEADVAKIKTIFWANNIVDFTPFLETTVHLQGRGPSAEAPEVTLVGTWFQRDIPLPTGDSLPTGLRNLRSWWAVTGSWIDERVSSKNTPVMVGAELAKKNGWEVGEVLSLVGSRTPQSLEIQAIFESGSPDDTKIFAPLAPVQSLTGLAGKVDHFEVSAITTPENDLARQAAKNPRSLSTKEWDTWYCTAYVGAIAFQIEEVIPESRAKPVRQVAESEGTILKKTQFLMLLITLVSLVGTALGISNLVSAGVVERSKELGLMKALGASDLRVAVQILLETTCLGILGGVIGYGAGYAFAQLLSWTVFGSFLGVSPMVSIVVALMVALVTTVGCLPAIRSLLSLRPTEVLHGR